MPAITAGRPTLEARRRARAEAAALLRAYAESVGMSMSTAAAAALLDEGGDVVRRLEAIRDAEIRRQLCGERALRRGGPVDSGRPPGAPPGRRSTPRRERSSMKTLTVIVAAAVVLLSGAPARAADCTVIGATASDQALLDQTAAAVAASIPAGATIGDCGASVVSQPVPKGVEVEIADNGGNGQLGAIACGVIGQPYYVSTPTYVHLIVAWSCSAVYRSMSGTAVVRDSAEQFHQTKPAGSGQAHLEFSGILWYGYHNRAVYECPVTFAFQGVGFLGVCTNTTFI